MKSLIAPVIATASFVTIVLSCLGAASALNAPYRLHEFENLKSGIWTAGPVPIDRQSQNFERLAALSPAPVLREDPASNDVASVRVATAAQPPADTTAEAAATGSEFCQRKYRSYRSQDNSYQPSSGGPRRRCEVPASREPLQNAQLTQPSDPAAIAASPTHTAWCQNRYSSYNASDDTYQPFGGGERRTCVWPTTVASNG